MPYENHTLMGVHITDRVAEAVEVQRLLTEYGTNIKTRLGMHEVDKGFSAPNGLLVLEMVGDPGRIGELHDKLNAVEGVEAKCMEFAHPD
jgi:hypothetical protein